MIQQFDESPDGDRRHRRRRRARRHARPPRSGPSTGRADGSDRRSRVRRGRRRARLTPMQLGMIGLGRMGANMVRRLERDGHDCVGYDVDPDGRRPARRRDRHGRRRLPGRRSSASSAPRATCGSWCRPRSSTRRSPRSPRCSSRGDTIIDGGNSWYHDDVDRAAPLADEHGIDYVDVGTSGGTHGLERGYCLMIGGPDDAVARLAPIFDTLAPGCRRGRRARRRTPPPAATRRRPSAGWLHCGPSGAGHFVKMVHNGIEYGLMAAYAEGLNVLAKAGIGAETHAADAETAPLTHPEYYRYDLDLAAITEVWRRGSRRRQLAARPDRRGARPRPAPRRASPATSATPARAAGRSTRRSTRACPCPCCRPRCSNASARVAAPTSPTRCCPRCAPVSAATSSGRTRRDDATTRSTQRRASPAARADALVLFGATGDLAKRKLFPALYHLVRRSELTVPVDRRGPQRLDRRRLQGPRPGVRRSPTWRMPTSPSSTDMCGRLDLIQGDYAAPDTWQSLAATLDGCGSQTAVFYMAIPPDMFPTVAEKLASVGLNKRGRIVVEKPFGRDLESAQRPEPHAARDLPRGAHLPHRPLPRQGGRRGPPRVPLLEHAARTAVEPELRAQRAGHDGRVDRRRGPRQLLRGRRRDPRRAAEPPPAGRVPAGDGAARRSRRVVPAGREGQGAGGDGADRPAVHGARPVHRLPRGARRRSALDRRDVHRRPAGDRLVALGRRAVVRALRQGAAPRRHRGRRRAAQPAAAAVRRGRRPAARAQPDPLPPRQERRRHVRPAGQDARASTSTARASTSASTSRPPSASATRPTSA